MITEGEFSAFVLGAVVGSIITYWNVTREKRLISSVRKQIDFLADLHEFTPDQSREASSSQIATDEEILRFCRWGSVGQRSGQTLAEAYRKLDPISLAAEGIICEKLLGLPHTTVLAIMSRMQEQGPADINTLRSRMQTEIRFYTDAKTSRR